jgi:hypothetical protein
MEILGAEKEHGLLEVFLYWVLNEVVCEFEPNSRCESERAQVLGVHDARVE